MIRLAIAGLRHPHVETIIEEARIRPDVELVAIAERESSARSRYGTRDSVRTYVDFADMFEAEEIDVVGVAAINAERAAIVVAALDAGLHVIADKPMCTTLSDLAAIDTAWRRSGRQLSLALEKRFYAPTLAARKVLAAGELGTLTIVSASAPHKLTRSRRPAWMFDREQYGGLLNDLLVHDVDLMLSFSGATRGTLRAYAGGSEPSFPDHAVVAVRSSGGPLATLEAHWMSPEAAAYHGDYRMRLVGTEGTAELLWKDNILTVATHDRPPRVEPLPPGKRPAEDFFDALITDTSPLIDGVAAIAATRVALHAQDSADRDGEVSWDLQRPWEVDGTQT